MSLFLPFNVRRSSFFARRPKLDAQRPTLELSRRVGMTMIELVAALALFVLILGTLLTVMDTATSLWSSSRSQQTEQTKAENIADIIADDLYEAVTDNGVPTNSPSADIEPTFLLSTPPTNSSPNSVIVVIGLVRHASPRTYSDGNSANRLSLDAVFYTYYKNALFRHAIPLSYTTLNEPETLGELLGSQRTRVQDAGIHDKILDSLQNPATAVSVPWSYLLLSERTEMELAATLPKTYVKNPGNGADPVTLGKVDAFALPDQINLALRIYSAEDWSTYQPIKDNTSDDATLKKRGLGSFYSKLISFPAKGGSRLP